MGRIDIVKERLATTLETWRDGRSQTEVGDLLGWSQDVVSRVELRKTKAVDLEKVLRLAEVTGTSLDYLLANTKRAEAQACAEEPTGYLRDGEAPPDLTDDQKATLSTVQALIRAAGMSGRIGVFEIDTARALDVRDQKEERLLVDFRLLPDPWRDFLINSANRIVELLSKTTVQGGAEVDRPVTGQGGGGGMERRRSERRKAQR